jgi:hypothetical protein
MLRTFWANPKKWQGQKSLQPPKATKNYIFREFQAHYILFIMINTIMPYSGLKDGQLYTWR